MILRKACIYSTFIVLFSCGALAAIKNGSGEFVFDYNLAGELKKIPVYYYCPLNITPASRVVFVLHSNAQPAKSYRDEWKQYAEKHDFLLLCPEFSKTQFKVWGQYNAGNVYDYDKKRYTRKEEWTFNIIESLFDFAKKDRYLNAQAYCIFGQSSGAQFVHRMVLFMPEARFSMAIANGAGDYTLPVFDRIFSEGLQNTSVTQESLAQSFNKDLIILVGEKDNVSHIKPREENYDPNDRFWRAKDFYQTAKQQSEKLQCQLKWRLLAVPDANHNSPIFVMAASKLAAKSRSYFTNPNVKDANDSNYFDLPGDVNSTRLRSISGKISR
ncbi:MAG: hypothetical protein A2Y12_07115 [Planctomycetes bacterium GWF2_42_9]|nr:MAG: hypothetical protein A2Y12_07115 [Planctomycetes bacterium GWF2_42_9]HAL45554.1 hypothetical protein [Phycisphaerales bacterium]